MEEERECQRDCKVPLGEIINHSALDLELDLELRKMIDVAGTFIDN